MANTVNQTDVRNFLDQSMRVLVFFLGRVLPAMRPDWWEVAVLSVLTPQQLQRVNYQQVTALAGLDLSALLRVFDQNWWCIADSLNLPRSGRNFIKEMQTIRNKWAHRDTEAMELDDVYRDLDTIQRFCQLIDADATLVDEIHATKSAIFSKNHDTCIVAMQPQNNQGRGEANNTSERNPGVPRYYELYSQVLEILSDNQPRTSHDIRSELGAKMSYSGEILSAMKKQDTVGWCTWHLKSAGLVERPRRGMNVITDAGKKFLGQYCIITRELLKTIPGYTLRLKK